MSFKDAVSADIGNVFLNLKEFAEKRTVKYDGNIYKDIPVLFTNLKEKDRPRVQSDHAQGLYRVSATLHCALSDLDGNIPEKGMKLRINNCEGGKGFFYTYYVASSGVEMGMLRVELEAIDE